MGLVSQGRSKSRLSTSVASGTSGDRIQVNEIYLDGKLNIAQQIDEDEKSYGIFMHSLILSNYAEMIKVNSREVDIVGDECEKAISRFTASKGFDKRLFESIAPKVDGLSLADQKDLKTSAYLINEKVRIISKGTPDAILKRCSYILLDSKIVKVTRRIFKDVNAAMVDMLNRSLSVYALAIKDISRISEALNPDTCVNDMTLVALVGMGRA